LIQLAWTLLALPIIVGIYAYIVYPLILWAIAHLAKEIPKDAAFSPTVTVVIPAYNEENQIRGAVEAVLAQGYPKDKLQLLILSDASTDATDRIVGEYAAEGVELMRMPQRGGKTKAENAALSRVRGEIIVNTDASIRLHPAAVRELVSQMMNPSIGVASGRDISVSSGDKTQNVTEASYVNYEMWVRTLETKTGGIVGASGSCYAIRSELHRVPIREDLSRDFCAALTARLHGMRSVSVDEAVCFVPRTSSLQREYERKVRTISRGMDTLVNRKQLLHPGHYGTFAWKLFSHKVCRWLLPIAVIPGVIGLAMLSHFYMWAEAALIVAGLIVVLALAGVFWPSSRPLPRLVSLAAFGLAANLAVVNAVWRVIHGHHDHVWEPTRRSA
jgi:cellulose synthase/poly-beta-1,6-N-acetylglucosamine synthase-like glycosyltransferase